MQNQINDWLNLLNNIKQENTMYKIVLSNLVDNSVMSEFLLKAEGIHNDLITNDLSISLLTDSILNLRSRLENKDPKTLSLISNQKVQIEDDIKNLKNRFNLVRNWFDQQAPKINHA